jgi:hypothetical protein
MSTTDEVKAGIRAWAKGHKPTMAAVEFLILAGQVPSQYVGENVNADGGATHWVDFTKLAADFDEGYLDYLSGGEFSTIGLALAIHSGVVDDYFWRLDPERQRAFLAALTMHA